MSGASGAIAPIIGMVSDQVTGSQNRMYGRASAEKQYQNQRKLNQQGKDLALEMWRDTNYSAQIGEMERAGLNPNMLYGGVGAGGTTASTGSGGSASQAQATQGNSATSAGISGMSQMGMLAEQKALMQAQKDNIEANTNKTNIEASNIEEPITAGISKTLAERDATQIQNEIQGDTKQEQKIGIASEATSKQQQALLDTRALDDRLQQIKSDAIGSGLENILTQAKTQHTYQDVKNLKMSIRKMQADISQGWEGLSLQERRNKLTQFAEELKAEYPNAGQAIGRTINEVYNYLMEVSGTPTNAKTVDSKGGW